MNPLIPKILAKFLPIAFCGVYAAIPYPIDYPYAP
jgi:hypothetical protein